MRLSQQFRSKRIGKPSPRGMTMIELLIAMAVLAIGMGGMLTVFVSAISGNGRAKFDTSGTMLAQTVLERIAAQPANVAANITIQDCNPAGPVTWTIATAPGGAAITAAGSAGYNPGDIDWVNQAYGAVPANYKMQFMACGNNGQATPFDVRWNVTTISANARLITVSARALSADNATGATLYSRPVTLRGIGGV
jgi:type IV pilus modification protein PilV